MKLFENKVGRPSNEVIKKRRNFYVLAVIVSIAMVGFLSLATIYFLNNAELLRLRKVSASLVKKKYIITLKQNGAKEISKTSVSCTTTGSSCNVKLPAISAKKGFTVVGWAASAKSTKAKYKPNATVKLTGNTTLYSITQGHLYRLRFYATGYGTYERTCSEFNGVYGCFVTAPTITPKKGHVIKGWTATKNSKVVNVRQGQTVAVSKSANYYAVITKK